ncbi:MAG: hypothetical protein WKF58_03855 [Ilumatobacteraceae bacterium]
MGAPQRARELRSSRCWQPWRRRVRAPVTTTPATRPSRSPAQGPSSTTLDEGVVRIVLESPSAQFDDTITLDVTADAAAVNDSGVYATCTPLDESPSAGGSSSA